MKANDECMLLKVDYAGMGKRIKEVRKQLQLTQADLGKSVGLSTSFIGHIERGTRITSLETILRISRVLNIAVDELLTGRPSTSAPPNRIITRKLRIFYDVMNVLYEYSEEWLRNV